MRRALLVVSVLIGCVPAAPDASVVVELRTDLVPGIEFDLVEFVGDLSFSRPIGREEIGADFTGARILGEIDATEGVHHFEARLLLSGEVVVGRTISLQVEGRTGLTLMMNRDCIDVICEGEQTCFAGQCVSDVCITGSEPGCDFVAACDADTPCPGAADCARVSCIPPGICFPERFDCPEEEFCDVTFGCRSFTLRDDGGVAFRDGGPDLRNDGGPDLRSDGGIMRRDR